MRPDEGGDSDPETEVPNAWGGGSIPHQPPCAKSAEKSSRKDKGQQRNKDSPFTKGAFKSAEPNTTEVGSRTTDASEQEDNDPPYSAQSRGVLVYSAAA